MRKLQRFLSWETLFWSHWQDEMRKHKPMKGLSMASHTHDTGTVLLGLSLSQKGGRKEGRVFWAVWTMFSLCCSFLSTTIVEFRPRLLQSNVAPTSLACPGESHLHGFAYDHPSNKERWHEGSWHDVFRTHIPPVTHAVTNFRKTTKQMVGRVWPMYSCTQS